jgi:DNA polymerase III epsilon subunit-like protein
MSYISFSTSRTLHILPMRILFFDTETNGLPYNRYLPPTHLKNWPHILQVAWQMWDGNVLVTKTSALVRPPPDLVWSTEAAAVHGIQKEELEKAGRPVEEVLALFKADVLGADLLVAHNLSFDKNVIWAAALRTQRADLAPATWWPTDREFCTLRPCTTICKIPATGKKNPQDPYKWPKLAEVWTWLWPSRPLPANLHNAAADVECLVACWRELLQRRLLVLPSVVLEAAMDRFFVRFNRLVERSLRVLAL